MVSIVESEIIQLKVILILARILLPQLELLLVF